MRLITLAATALLAGCAGRAPQPMQLVQISDQHLSCEQIVAEIKGNNQKISDLAQEEGLKVAQNVAAGVAGFVVPVLWFGMDFQDAAGKEGKSLSQRNEYLSTLASQRCGTPTTTASLPARRQ